MPDTMATGWARGLPHAILDGVRVRPTVFRAPGEARGLGDFSVSAVSRAMIVTVILRVITVMVITGNYW